MFQSRDREREREKEREREREKERERERESERVWEEGGTLGLFSFKISYVTVQPKSLFPKALVSYMTNQDRQRESQ